MRSLTLLVVTLLTSQFAFAGATAESTATVNTGTAEATLVRNEALADDPGNRPPAGTQLAFVRDDQIYLVNADGTGLAQLTNTGGGVANRDPAWSRDGQRLAFARGIPDGFGTWDIHIMDADGSNVVQVTSGGHNVEPAWGPDDRMIAFTFFSLLTGSAGVSVIDVDADGSQGSRVLLDFPGWDAQPAWSPDGQTITFTSDWRAYDFVYDLYVMKADGSNVRPLLEGPFFSVDGLTYFFQSAWSPDGQSLAVVVCPYAWDDCYPDSAIAVTNADGSGLRVIAEAGSYARPTWSPDGRWIAYGSSLCRTCPSSVRFVHVDGGTEGPIVDNGHSPAWRPEIAAPINAGLNDAWVSDDAPNQGFFFTVYPDLGLFFLSWFTFDSTLPDGDVTAEFGAPDQRWVTGAGFYSGDSVTVNVELTSGGIFNGSNPEASQQSNYGTITIQFINCNQATLTYNFPGLGLSGQMTLTRVLTDNVALCEALLLNAQTGTAKAEAGPTGLEAAPQPEEAPARGSPQSQATLAAIQINAGLNDAWVSQDAPKQGFFFTVYPDQGLFFLSWFTFDSTLPDGDVTAEFGAPDQRWVTGVGFYSGDSVSLNAELTTGGIFNGSDSEAAQQANYGTITITFISCNEATLAYNFPSLGLSGQMTLTRVLTDNVALCEELAAP